ncbi:hypothetical protein ACLEIY_07520 [Acetobacter tropicalis]|uniref:Uncharacterized protein n=3 Tax=Acetobacter TaxID=434 RepID=A0A149U0J0_9PROT|nr:MULTISPECIES: hypothetical protein [Acetobacter]GAA07617.1 hypothetical protein ATPR_0621 [Acetobacter tropicalis NBRC 101654]ATJ91383.1 hypothetical protein CIW82_12505 [Acetobacter tropicalis]KXV46059.1 hypothetical protein AD944_13690 [Acetobacter tropicalis]KXV58985.1 hypothetical protein AD948_09700 [Acetobacter senegalensis]MCG4257124.1 hypothetical protein [Acetobacter senegalensis]
MEQNSFPADLPRWTRGGREGYVTRLVKLRNRPFASFMPAVRVEGEKNGLFTACLVEKKLCPVPCLGSS